MITLITGLPGAGKSLYALDVINARAKREGRAVYYEGIEGLTLPWLELNGQPWFKAPQGSIIVIDEAQRRYRPRGLGQAVPEEVAKYETHRHGGYDIYLITQHPMLLDSNVRRLVNQHFHVMRNFGARRATVHEFMATNDNPDKSRKDSIRHEWGYPKSLFGAYKSAEMHTHKLRLPLRFWVLVAIPFLLLPLVYKAGMWFYDTASGHNKVYTIPEVDSRKGLAGVKVVSNSIGGGVVNPVGADGVYTTPVSYALSRKPVIGDLPYTSPVYQALSKPTIVPVVASCVATKARCYCYSQQSTRVGVSEDMCRYISVHGRLFQDFEPVDLKEKAQDSILGTDKGILNAGMLDAPTIPSRVLPDDSRANPVPNLPDESPPVHRALLVSSRSK